MFTGFKFENVSNYLSNRVINVLAGSPGYFGGYFDLILAQKRHVTARKRRSSPKNFTIDVNRLGLWFYNINLPFQVFLICFFSL